MPLRAYAFMAAIATFIAWLTIETGIMGVLTFLVRVALVLFVLAVIIKLVKAIVVTLGLSRAAREGY